MELAKVLPEAKRRGTMRGCHVGNDGLLAMRNKRVIANGLYVSIHDAMEPEAKLQPSYKSSGCDWMGGRVAVRPLFCLLTSNKVVVPTVRNWTRHGLTASK